MQKEALVVVTHPAEGLYKGRRTLYKAQGADVTFTLFHIRIFSQCSFEVS